MRRTTIGSIVLLAALATLFSPVGATAATSAAGPQALASRQCKPVTTNNGGRATFINIFGTLSCRKVRRIAARANGKRYQALGVKCKPDGKPQRFGRLQVCRGIVNGNAQGIAFFYKQPSASGSGASRKCRNVKTLNGGTVSLLFANTLSCRRARMVAKRANGKAYRAFGFICTRSQFSGQAGQGFSCRRTKPGTGQGIAFSYKKG